jgi:hypothetical protein
VWNERQGLLNREQQAARLEIEGFVEMRLGNVFKTHLLDEAGASK